MPHWIAKNLLVTHFIRGKILTMPPLFRNNNYSNHALLQKRWNSCRDAMLDINGKRPKILSHASLDCKELTGGSLD